MLALISISIETAAQEHSTAKQQLAWQAWSNQVFADAKREHRFVLLDLEAVWCHWCHVMDANTFCGPTTSW
jgi:hypothetical protein